MDAKAEYNFTTIKRVICHRGLTLITYRTERRSWMNQEIWCCDVSFKGDMWETHRTITPGSLPLLYHRIKRCIVARRVDNKRLSHCILKQFISFINCFPKCKNACCLLNVDDDYFSQSLFHGPVVVFSPLCSGGFSVLSFVIPGPTFCRPFRRFILVAVDEIRLSFTETGCELTNDALLLMKISLISDGIGGTPPTITIQESESLILYCGGGTGILKYSSRIFYFCEDEG